MPRPSQPAPAGRNPSAGAYWFAAAQVASSSS